MDLNLLVPIIIVAALVVFVVMSAVRIVPQARRYNVERFGRYRTTLQPGLNFIIPLADRINTKLDVREQVYSAQPKPVITEDNLGGQPRRAALARQWPDMSDVQTHRRNRSDRLGHCRDNMCAVVVEER